MPAVFGTLEVVGVAATCDLPANTVVACIPNKFIITRYTVLKSDVGKLVEDNPNIFDEKIYQSNEFNYFVVFLIREKLKGKDSFY